MSEGAHCTSAGSMAIARALPAARAIAASEVQHHRDPGDNELLEQAHHAVRRRMIEMRGRLVDQQQRRPLTSARASAARWRALRGEVAGQCAPVGLGEADALQCCRQRAATRRARRRPLRPRGSATFCRTFRSSSSIGSCSTRPIERRSSGSARRRIRASGCACDRDGALGRAPRSPRSGAAPSIFPAPDGPSQHDELACVRPRNSDRSAPTRSP